MDDSPNQDRDSFHSPEFGRALGRTIKVMRTEQGIGRRGLAERAGISYSYVTEIENGDKPASSKVLAMIAGALGLRLHELIEGAERRAERLEIEREAEREILEYPSAAARWEEAIRPPSARNPGRRERARQESLPSQQLSISAGSAMDGNLSYPGPTPPIRSYAARTPRSLMGVMRELQDLLAHMEPDDVERVLDLARRMAR